jgi:imidazolonepropionase-like amidohydrolase
MVEGGMTPSAALQTATINPAKFLHLDETRGTVTVGKRADLVLLDANPLTDISNVRRINAVVLGERLFRRVDLDKLLAQARVAAAQ